jgi:hypothetical protein
MKVLLLYDVILADFEDIPITAKRVIVVVAALTETGPES